MLTVNLLAKATNIKPVNMTTIVSTFFLGVSKEGRMNRKAVLEEFWTCFAS